VPQVTDKDGTTFAPPVEASESDEEKADQLASDIQRLGRTQAGAAKEAELLKKYPTTNAAIELFYIRATEAKNAGHLAEALDYYARLLYYRPNYEKNVFGTECDYYDDYVRHFREKQDSLEELHSHLVHMQEFMGSQPHTQEIHRDTKDISHILADLFEQLERIYIAKQANSKNFNLKSLEDYEFFYKNIIV